MSRPGGFRQPVPPELEADLAAGHSFYLGEHHVQDFEFDPAVADGAMSASAGDMALSLLALGAQTVQFCTAVMKYGLGYVDELHSGLSYLMQERGFGSVKELIGSALPDPITDFESLSPTKQIPQVVASLCTHCGNCERCPYQAIRMDGRGVPKFDPGCCVGCSLCAQKCFAGAISMRDRTRRELSLLKEG